MQHSVKPRPALSKAGQCDEHHSLVSCIEIVTVFDVTAMNFVEIPDKWIITTGAGSVR